MYENSVFKQNNVMKTSTFFMNYNSQRFIFGPLKGEEIPCSMARHRRFCSFADCLSSFLQKKPPQDRETILRRPEGI